jgi:hypothetical protein
MGFIRHVGGKILKPDIQSDGYSKVRLHGGVPALTRLIHRLVAEVFVPNPNNYSTVNHIDGFRSNNTFENLEWVSIAMNSNAKVFPATTRKGRNIVQLDGNRDKIKIWESAVLAARFYNISSPGIGVACKTHNKAAGFFWRYADEIEQENGEMWRKWEFGTVSNLGRIRSAQGAIVSGSMKLGYRRYKGYAIHRVVASAFPEICPRIDGQNVVNHKDGNRDNPAAANLEWTTPSGNAIHAYDMGLNSRRKAVQCITTAQVYVSVREASQQTSIDQGSIIKSCKSTYRLAGGRRWKYCAAIDQVPIPIDDEIIAGPDTQNEILSTPAKENTNLLLSECDVEILLAELCFD